jgi:Molybdopterin-guanine dinucleotide biosynthesis protein A
MRIGVAILAGGQGTRIGGDKPMRHLGGESLFQYALSRALAWNFPTVLVLRSIGQVEVANVPVILDDAEIPGPLGGLSAALNWSCEAGLDAVLTLPCDMPFLPDDLAERLVQGLGADQRVAVAVSGGRAHPVCALWRTSLRADLQTRAALGLMSLRGMAAAAGMAEVHWPLEPRDPFFNINTPGDLANAVVWLDSL